MTEDGWKPALNPAIKLQVLDGEAVLLDRENELVHQLDSVGTRMLELCDGQNSLSQIVEVLLEHYEVDERRLRRDASEFFQRLRTLQVLI